MAIRPSRPLGDEGPRSGYLAAFRARAMRGRALPCGGTRMAVGKSCASQGGDDVGLTEVVPLEQEGLARDLGERIGEAVAEIQSGRVPAFAKVEECLAREVRLLERERFDANPGSAKKNIPLPARVRPNLAFNDD